MALVITVIPHYNGGETLPETLAALARTDYAPHEILVVDDGSTDGVLGQAARDWPEIRVLRGPRNRGFAHAVNAGLAAAWQRGAAYVFLLNNDVVVAPDTIRHLVAAAAASERIAAVMPKVYFFDRPEVVQCAGVCIDRNTGISRLVGWREPDRGQWEQAAVREALHGCAMLIRRAAWQTVGPYWEPYFAYFEDMDWCVRARDHGYRLGYVPRARVWHHGGASFDHASPGYLYLLARNRLFFVRRNRRNGRPLRDAGTLALFYLRNAGRALKRRRFREVAVVGRALLDFGRRRTGAPI